MHIFTRTLLSRLSIAMIKLKCTSLDVLYRWRRSCIWWNFLSLFLSASRKNVREKNTRSHACLEDLRQKGSSNLDPSEVKESKILPRSLAVHQCRVSWYACIICTHLLEPGESSVRRVLIIGSGWPNCFALDSSFLVLDNLSRILAKRSSTIDAGDRSYEHTCDGWHQNVIQSNVIRWNVNFKSC